MSWSSVRRRLRRLYVQTVRARGAPRDVALGMAIGLFVSFIPVAQTLIALAVVEAVRRLTGTRASRVAALIGVWFTNPLTAAPVYALSLFVGLPVARFVLKALHVTGFNLGGADSWLREPAVLESAVALVAGSVMLGTPTALVGYELTRRAVVAYQDRRVARQRARALRAVGLNPAALAPPAERAAQ